MSKTKRRLNLNVGINTTGYLANAWKYRSGDRHDINDIGYYRRLTELAHKGRFDAVFLSDHPALLTDPASRPFHTIDPLILSTSLAAQVPDIGFVATVSSTYNSPYNFARRTQSIDLVTGGRLIVNIVSSFNPNVAANFGNDPLPPRSERYAKATEFLDVAKKLWSSWDPRREGEVPEERFWDAATAGSIDHEGQYFHVKGPLNVPRGPQGHPVIAQAGPPKAASIWRHAMARSSIATSCHDRQVRPSARRSATAPSPSAAIHPASASFPASSSFSARPVRKRCASMNSSAGQARKTVFWRVSPKKTALIRATSTRI